MQTRKSELQKPEGGNDTQGRHVLFQKREKHAIQVARFSEFRHTGFKDADVATTLDACTTVKFKLVTVGN
jgi:hypothetical protein